MANRLSKVEFAADLLHLVTGFDCGDEEWAREVADWIQKAPGQGGALDELANRQTHPLTVWLHFNDEQELVGFSSLMRFSGFMMPRISLIPNLAVAKTHQGKGYIRDIMGHLIATAQAEVASGRLPVLGLFVHPHNQRAIDTYKCFGFQPTTERDIDSVTGIEYIGMLLRIG
jgi:ribosomal protein S18 acetylase RimI-like enzyme